MSLGRRRTRLGIELSAGRGLFVPGAGLALARLKPAFSGEVHVAEELLRGRNAVFGEGLSLGQRGLEVALSIGAKGESKFRGLRHTERSRSWSWSGSRSGSRICTILSSGIEKCLDRRKLPFCFYDAFDHCLPKERTRFLQVLRYALADFIRQAKEFRATAIAPIGACLPPPRRFGRVGCDAAAAHRIENGELKLRIDIAGLGRFAQPLMGSIEIWRLAREIGGPEHRLRAHVAAFASGKALSIAAARSCL